MIGQQDTTHILTADINFSSKQNLQKLISNTLSRWNVIKGHTEWNEHIYYDDIVAKKTNRLSNDTYLFEVETIGANTYDVSMSVFGSRYRRGGSSMDFFERLMDALEVQLLHPETEFAKMTDCYNLAYPPLELDFLNSGLEEEAVEDLEEDASEAVEEEDRPIPPAPESSLSTASSPLAGDSGRSPPLASRAETAADEAMPPPLLPPQAPHCAETAGTPAVAAAAATASRAALAAA